MDNQLEPALTRFRNAALRYCEFVDSLSTHSSETFLVGIEKHLLEIYTGALSLPTAEPDETDVDYVQFAEETRTALYTAIRETIGTREYYWTIFDSSLREGPVEGSLADDIAGVYFDLREWLQAASDDVSDVSLLWDLELAFRSHWGHHAISALKAIRDLHLRWPTELSAARNSIRALWGPHSNSALNSSPKLTTKNW
jgi:hypothetical protein